MSQPYVGEIRIAPFNFAPVGWALCDGSLIAISQNETLFNLIGTTYGGDGQTNFALPDLRGRCPIHQGTGFSTYIIGQIVGSETHTLTQGQIPAHSHLAVGANVFGTKSDPTGQFPAQLDGGLAYAPSGTSTMAANAVTSAGGGQPHNNMQPFTTVNYIISLFGIFPSQN